MSDWEKIKEKCAFENGELIQVSFADDYIQSLQAKVTKLEAESKTLEVLHNGEVIISADLQSRIDLERRNKELQAKVTELEKENKKLRKIIALSENNLEPERKWIKPRQKHWNTK